MEQHSIVQKGEVNSHPAVKVCDWCKAEVRLLE